MHLQSNGNITTETANREAARWWLHNPPIQPYSEVAIAPGFTAATELKYAAARPPLQDQPGVPPYDFHPSTSGVIMNPYNSPDSITSENSVDVPMSNLTPLPQVKARVFEYLVSPDSLLTFRHPTSHSQLPGTCRPGRRGSQQCSRCRSHKRGKRVRSYHWGIY